MGHLVCKTTEISPYIESFVDRNGREGFSDAALRRVYDILNGKTDHVTHKVADKLCVEMDRLDILHNLHFEEVDFR